MSEVGDDNDIAIPQPPIIRLLHYGVAVPVLRTSIPISP